MHSGDTHLAFITTRLISNYSAPFLSCPLLSQWWWVVEGLLSVIEEWKKRSEESLGPVMRSWPALLVAIATEPPLDQLVCVCRDRDWLLVSVWITSNYNGLQIPLVALFTRLLMILFWELFKHYWSLYLYRSVNEHICKKWRTFSPLCVGVCLSRPV